MPSWTEKIKPMVSLVILCELTIALAGLTVYAVTKLDAALAMATVAATELYRSLRNLGK